ncbi:MAG TPA: hypothetical protein VHM30_03410 [Gemmatimonadaceae bacterium]|nr:hypothetical protein [Gemmatimonadaceae bacterium]
MRKQTMIALAVAAGIAIPVLAQAQQQDTTKSKPVTPATVATATGKVAKKAGKQTEKQAKRTAKGVKKVYSRKARQEGKIKNEQRDSTKAKP